MGRMDAFDRLDLRSRPLPNRRALVVSGLFATLLATLVPPTAASAQDQGKPADGGGWPQSWSLPASPSLGSAPRWTFSIEAIALARSGGVSRPLISTLSGADFFSQTSTLPAAEAFNSNQFRQGLAAGPKVSVIYHGDSGYGMELSYFNVLNLSATKAIGPNGDWLVMKAPGIFTQTQDFADQAMVWRDDTSFAERRGQRAARSFEPCDHAGWITLDPTHGQPSGLADPRGSRIIGLERTLYEEQ